MAGPLERLESTFGELDIWDGGSVMAQTETNNPRSTSNSISMGQIQPAGSSSVVRPVNITDGHGRLMRRVRNPLAVVEPDFNDPEHDQYVYYDEEACSMGGDEDGNEVRFCPWTLLLNYSLLFIGKEKQKAVRHFFTAEVILESRPWDFYYLYHPRRPRHSAVLFVPTRQFASYIRLINSKLDSALDLPQAKKADYICFTFGGVLNTPTPRYLGRSTSFSEGSILLNGIPEFSSRDTLGEFSEMAQDDFVKNLEMIERISVGADADEQRAKKKAKAREKRVKARVKTGHAIKRVQRYLGLRRKASGVPGSGTQASPGGALEINFAMPNQPDSCVIFISVDVELFEFNHSHITEVGISILDTLQTIGVPPGQDYENWFDLIEAHHFRIKEYRHEVNRKHVRGSDTTDDDAETSTIFRKSETIKLNDIRAKLKEIFAINRSSQPMGSASSSLEDRPIVIVGHDIEMDISYLKTLGVFIDTDKYDIADTQTMHQNYRRRFQGAKLQDVLGDLQLTSRYLHNAGNDAVYTLRAMIALAFRTREHSLEKLATDYVDESEDEMEGGWTTGGEDSDGGSTPWERAAEQSKRPAARPRGGGARGQRGGRGAPGPERWGAW
ncbi:uncharacterized protein E0L32_007172 [Thyridium curvatum]|uniref:Gfd2/YDR514C-like C-terminal domain-containing protein n=1 Tax=Thyridium curvatum TaxID=1093900 RepID=A0A507AX46_9PEZI|nr:uncharacterized protein E0L32_007172 [Thyridium curvatum]TPX12057.1 hypothetical protein E0L32_007172 [Thyridium curvatum]